MNKLIIILLSVTCLYLTGCSKRTTPGGARNAVYKEFQTTDIQTVPGSIYTFIVRATNGSVWYVKCDNIDDNEISSKCILFK
jgi:outer membrane lipoprotein SlyB